MPGSPGCCTPSLGPEEFSLPSGCELFVMVVLVCVSVMTGMLNAVFFFIVYLFREWVSKDFQGLSPQRISFLVLLQQSLTNWMA